MDTSGCVTAAAALAPVTNLVVEDDSSKVVTTLQDSRESEFLEGSRLSDNVTFKQTNGKKECSVCPLLVDFRRLLQGSISTSISIVPRVSNKDLVHAVVGLYDVSLSEMTPDVLYNTTCEKWARTILLVRDTKDVLAEFEARRAQKNIHNRARKVVSDGHILHTQGNTANGDHYEPGEDMQATFAPAYSDTDSDSAANSDDEEEAGSGNDSEDFSKGIATFLKAAEIRRKERLQHQGRFDEGHVGAENKLVAAITYEKKYIKSGEKVIHVTIVSVRKRFRGMGIGKYLLQQVKDPLIVGTFDAVVAHVDNSAIDFFSRYGFSDDVVLNSRWRELAEQFTNCTMMCYLPPYAGQAMPEKISDFDLFGLEQDLKKWKEKNTESYQAQVTCIGRMKAEIIRLRAIVSTQQQLLDELHHRIDSTQQEKCRQDKELLLMNNIRSAMMRYKGKSEAHEDDEEYVDEQDGSGDSDDDGSKKSASLLIEGLEQELRRYRLCSEPLSDDASGSDTLPEFHLAASPAMVPIPENELKRYAVSRRSDEVYDHGKDIAIFHQICEDFTTSIKKDPKITQAYSITSISKALLTSGAVERYGAKRRMLGDSPLIMRVYFSGSLAHPERLQEIMKSGFSENDFEHGDYGYGLYFSRYASTAAQFSVPNKLLIAEVATGKCETILKKDRSRKSPNRGYDSLLTPGRLLPTKDDATVIQEYVLFDAAQALPLFQIDYRLTDVSFTAE